MGKKRIKVTEGRWGSMYEKLEKEDNRINQQVTEILSCHLTLREGLVLMSQVCASALL